MGKHFRTPNGIREWTKEEMMSYLDWDKAESERVERNIAMEIAN